MLPEPCAKDKTRSAKLCARIRKRIARAGGRIGFDAFMQEALYAPALGYYANAPRFDARGDFTTAPQLGKIAAQCLAAQCMHALAEIENGALLEFGGGRGKLAADILSAMQEHGVTPKYFLVETSGALRACQRQTLTQRGFAGQAQWLSRAPQNFRGVVIANEVLDAMPVTRFAIDKHARACELCVSVDAQGNFCPAHGAELPAKLQQRIDCKSLGVGYTSELNLHAETWLRKLSARIDTGVLLFLDYGFPRREFYHPQRRGGTLMCHYRHRAHPDPFFHPGLQDITAHIDFTAMQESAHAGGMQIAGYATQAAFLLSLGALDHLARAQTTADEPTRIHLSREMQTLTMPHEMGELIKVIAFRKNCTAELQGFALQDRSAAL